MESTFCLRCFHVETVLADLGWVGHFVFRWRDVTRPRRKAMHRILINIFLLARHTSRKSMGFVVMFGGHNLVPMNFN